MPIEPSNPIFTIFFLPEVLVCTWRCVAVALSCDALIDSVNNEAINKYPVVAVGKRLLFADVNTPPAPLYPWTGSMCVLSLTHLSTLHFPLE